MNTFGNQQADLDELSDEFDRLWEKYGALEKALQATLKVYVDSVNCGDGGNGDPESEEHVQKARALLG